MVKKLNELGVTIKNLLTQGLSKIWIARKLRIRWEKVNYLTKNPIKRKQKKKKKIRRFKGNNSLSRK